MTWSIIVLTMYLNMNFQMFKLDLEKAEEPEIKLPTSVGSYKKQESFRKISTSALLTMPKPLTVWITRNKASGSDGIPVELFQILKYDAVKVLHSICQQIWKSAVATGLQKVSFHSNPKERQCQRMLKLLHNCTHLTC